MHVNPRANDDAFFFVARSPENFKCVT